jgi:transcriptional regulator with XRE-family HTH domain
MTDTINLDHSAADEVSDKGLDALPSNRPFTASVKRESPTGNPDQGGPVVSRMTKADFLDAARSAVEQGHRYLRDAAEALGEARERHDATQREMAEAVGMSVGWINRLLKWRRLGYQDASPFGPTTKQGRVQHAERRNQRKANETVEADHQIAATQSSSSQAIEKIKLEIDQLDDEGRAEIFSYIKQKKKSAAL